MNKAYSYLATGAFKQMLDMAYEDDILNLVRMTLNRPFGKIEVINNFNDVWGRLSGEDLADFINMMPNRIKRNIANENYFAYSLFYKNLICKNTLGAIIKAKASDLIQKIIVNFSYGQNMFKLGQGSFSDVVLIGKYVLKLGEARGKYEMPYHPNVLQPLLREQFLDARGRSILVVEVQEKVDTENVTDEDICVLREEFKKCGIICSDLYKDNIGLLIKPNKRMLYNGKGGIFDINGITEKTLGVGSPVVLDTDFLYVKKQASN